MKSTICFTLAAALISGTISCTGINLGVYPYRLVGNSHPAKEYAEYTVILKGGGVYHRHSVAGQIGEARSIKTGRACSKSILGLIGYGDSSIARARELGSITRIASLEHEIMALFGFVYHRHCTVVTGE